jgi:ACR3 family arsenite transporter
MTIGSTFELTVPNVISLGVPIGLFGVVYLVSARPGFSSEDAVAVAFNSAGRDFEIAITAFGPTVALATVVGPLIEVPVMPALVWGAMRLRRRLFGPAGHCR